MSARRACSLVILVAAVGCGRIGYDVQADGGPDIEPPDSSLGDAGPSTVDIAEPAEPWSPPVLAAELNSGQHDDDPTMTPDGLVAIFTSARTGGLGEADVYESVRASRDEPWGVPVHVPELSSPAYDNTPGLSADGLTIWLARDVAGDEDIYVAHRATRASTWSVPRRVAELSSSRLDRAPETFANELMLVFQSPRAGGVGSDDFYTVTRPDVMSPWSTPELLASLSSPLQDIQCWMSEGGTRAYFNSNRDGNMDFYVARRASIDDDFEPAERIAELSSADYDADLALTGDERYVLFSRSGDLYESSR